MFTVQTSLFKGVTALDFDHLKLLNFSFNVDPDPAFHYNADPDPAFHSNADPNPISKNYADLCGSRSATLVSSAHTQGPIMIIQALY